MNRSELATKAMLELQAAVVRVHRKAREAQRMERMVDAATILDDTLRVVSVEELEREDEIADKG